MIEITTCKHCGTNVIPTVSGECPSCRNPLDGSPISEVLATENHKPKLRKSTINSSSIEESLMSGKNWLSDLLDKLEDLEVKMIYGFFQFIFWKVPKFIKDTLINWFPTLVKLIKVIFLFIVWLVIISSPLIYFVYTNYDSEQISDSFAKFSSNEYLIVTFWVVIGLIGSIWGIFHVHRKQYNWFKSIKSFVLHRNKQINQK